MSMSRLDQLYRRLLLTKFFTHGWGKPENLKRLFAFRKILSNRETCQHLVAADYPINIDKEYKDNGHRILEGHFTSPFVHHLPGIMPKEVETAKFQVILPEKWQHPPLKPVCIHLAGTGDHYFWRRRLFTARPLLKETGIASILLENPYYGTRKPKEQVRSSLHNVSDLFVMGGGLVLESLALLHWCERQGWGPLGLSGISMGGHMASLAATNWTKPISLVPCLSWSTASCVFTEGVMSGSIPWQTLQEQFFENSVYQEEIRQLIISPEDKRRKAYDMGQQFVKEYSSSIEQMESMHEFSSVQKSKKSVDLLSPDLHRRKNIETKRPDTNSKGIRDTESFISTDEYLSHMQSELPVDGKLQSNTAVKSDDPAPAGLPSAPIKPIITLTSLLQDSKLDSGHSSPDVEKTSKPVTSSPLSLSSKFSTSKSKLMKLQQKSGEEQVKNLQQEALDFMRGVMDECTHLGNFSVPVDPELIIIVSAKQDAYVPKGGVLGLDDLWEGCEVRQVDDGHIGAVLWHQSVFRKAIADAFDKQVKKYYENPRQQPNEHFREAKGN